MEGDFVWKIQFVNDSVGFGSVQSFFGTEKRILKTLDGGESWNSLTVVENDTSDFTFQGIGFVNDTLGWVGGWGNGLFQTIDGGLNWELIPIGSNFNRFFPISPNLVYASGNRLYRYIDTLNLNTPDTTNSILSSRFQN
ncbi:MAG: YCF48-related protein, partial [Bacteroidota bacterium]